MYRSRSETPASIKFPDVWRGRWKEVEELVLDEDVCTTSGRGRKEKEEGAGRRRPIPYQLKMTVFVPFFSNSKATERQQSNKQTNKAYRLTGLRAYRLTDLWANGLTRIVAEGLRV